MALAWRPTTCGSPAVPGGQGMQDKQMDVLNAIKLFSDEGLKSYRGLSNNSNGAPKKRPSHHGQRPWWPCA